MCWHLFSNETKFEQKVEMFILFRSSLGCLIVKLKFQQRREQQEDGRRRRQEGKGIEAEQTESAGRVVERRKSAGSA